MDRDAEPDLAIPHVMAPVIFSTMEACNCHA